ncbi:hypothetical protein VBH15_13915 [Vagococcus fluvialis]|uniref:helix-turn-helix domain-containing protein n=1 Tax=Vagococcus fluvialis TaxID=2738 RepID=UPI0037CE03A5
MTIGEILKKLRIENGKTQREWINSIVSPSFYSKVENNEHRISADDLFNILNKNNIEINEFFSYINIDKSTFEMYNDDIIFNYFENNIKYLKNLKIKISMDNSLTRQDSFLLCALIDISLTDITESYDELDQETIIFLKNKFFSLENWTPFKLTLYTNIISLYDFHSNSEIIASILKKRIDQYTEEQRDSILNILINFISICISNNQDNLAKYYLSYLLEMPPSIKNLFQKSIGRYYLYVIKYREIPKKEYELEIVKIIDFLSSLGFDEFSNKLNNYFQEKVSKRN